MESDNDDNMMLEEGGQESGKLLDFGNIETPQALVSLEIKRVSVPPHRMTPLKANWEKIVAIIAGKMKLQIRMNVPRKCVEIRASEQTETPMALQKTVDFLKAFTYGFDINDAVALLRVEDLFLDSFEIKDVKTLHGDHMSRAIGRITGEKGKIKHSIENATKTRIVVADSKIHIMGGYGNLKLARTALSNLILGKPPSKINSQLKYIAKKKTEF